MMDKKMAGGFLVAGILIGAGGFWGQQQFLQGNVDGFDIPAAMARLVCEAREGAEKVGLSHDPLTAAIEIQVAYSATTEAEVGEPLAVSGKVSEERSPPSQGSCRLG